MIRERVVIGRWVLFWSWTAMLCVIQSFVLARIGSVPTWITYVGSIVICLGVYAITGRFPEAKR